MRRIYDIADFTVNAELCEALVRLDPAHAVFEGHFPGRPVVPGVCMLQMIASVIERAAGHPVVMTSLANVKYTAIIDPLETPEVRVAVTMKAGESGISASAEIRGNGKSFMKCKGIFA
jgi:3-hydroxyacyl-[acyl-carrier-protein] dehydratase